MDERKMVKKLEIKSKIIGPNPDQDKELVMLHRTVKWTDEGIQWSADPRHAEAIIRDLGLEEAHGVAAPCEESVKGIGLNRDKGTPLGAEASAKYRSTVAKANYLGMDRPDIQYIARMLSKGMSQPIESDLKHLKHFKDTSGGSRRSTSCTHGNPAPSALGYRQTATGPETEDPEDPSQGGQRIWVGIC